MKWYKSFYLQFKECTENGNKFTIIDHPLCKRPITVCKYFETYCHSEACMGKRRKEGIEK